MTIVHEIRTNVGEWPFLFVPRTGKTPPAAVLVDEHGTEHTMIDVESVTDDVFGDRWGARPPWPFWSTGRFVAEFRQGDEVVAAYGLEVRPHPVKATAAGGVELRYKIDEAKRMLDLPSADRAAVVAAFTPQEATR